MGDGRVDERRRSCRRINRRDRSSPKERGACWCSPSSSLPATAGRRRRNVPSGWHGVCRAWVGRPVVITRQLPAEGCTCGAGSRNDAEPQWEEGLEVIRVPARKWPAGPCPSRSDGWFFSSERPRTTGLPRLGLRLGSTPRTPTSISYGRRSAPITSLRLGRFFQRKLDVPWVAELRRQRMRGARSWWFEEGARRAGSFGGGRSLLARPLREADAVVHVTGQEAQADAALVPQTAAGRPKRLRRDGMG